MKIIKYFIYVVLLFFVFTLDCYAAPITYTRDMENLRIPEKMTKIVENNPDLKYTIVNIPAVNENQKLYDFADAFTEDEEKEIIKELDKYTKDTKIDSVIVVTNDLLGFNIAEYSYKFYDYNNFSKDGIIFVIYKGEEKTNIFMGNSGTEGGRVFKVYNDERINAILKYIYETYVRDGNYKEACLDYINITEKLYSKLYGHFKIDDLGNLVSDIPWLETIITAIAITFIIVLLVCTKFGSVKKRKDRTIKNSLNTESMVVKCDYDMPIKDINE